MENKKPIKDLAIMKMPVEYLDFLKKNPKLQEILGVAMVELTVIVKKYNDIVQILKTTDAFMPYMENGTREEFEKFINVMIKQLGTSHVFNNLPDGAYERIREELKKKSPMMETVFTG